MNKKKQKQKYHINLLQNSWVLGFRLPRIRGLTVLAVNLRGRVSFLHVFHCLFNCCSTAAQDEMSQKIRVLSLYEIYFSYLNCSLPTDWALFNIGGIR